MAIFTFKPSKPTSTIYKERKIFFIVYPFFEILDLTGPFEVFAFASTSLQRGEQTHQPVYTLEILAEKPGPVVSMSGMEVIATRSYHDIDEPIDTLFIPGGLVFNPEDNNWEGSVLKNKPLLSWIKSMESNVIRLASVCNGAFLLAECNLLNNKRVTTHWDFSHALQTNYPHINVEPDKIFIKDDNIFTSGGITSGIDLALSMVEDDWGRELALYVARYLVVFLKRPGGQSQFSTYLISESSNRPDIRQLQCEIINNPTGNYTVEELAKRMAMSPRNFSRTFVQETGITPGKFVEKARLDAARFFLENENLPIETVAKKSGFIDAERMRRTFIRHLGINPKNYRDRFNSHH